MNTLPLIDAVHRKDIEEVEQLLACGEDVNQQDENNDTALISACCSIKYGDWLDIIRLLLENNATINHQNRNGRTALMFAAASENRELVNLLLEEKAAVDIQDILGGTALFYAAEYGRFRNVQLLLENKANINHESQWGETPLSTAMYNTRIDVVRELLIQGAIVNKKDPHKEPFLLCSHHIKIIKMIKKHIEKLKAYEGRKQEITSFFKNTFFISKDVLQIVDDYERPTVKSSQP